LEDEGMGTNDTKISERRIDTERQNTREVRWEDHCCLAILCKRNWEEGVHTGKSTNNERRGVM
jgi:Tfp pilus assembly protein PilV